MHNTLTRTLSLRLTVFLTLLGSTFTICLGQHSILDYPISIIPQPREVTRLDTRFPLNRNTRIVLADDRSADDQFAAEDFIERPPQCVAEALIAEGEAMLAILAEDIQRETFDQRMIEHLRVAEGFLAALLLADVAVVDHDGADMGLVESGLARSKGEARRKIEETMSQKVGALRVPGL